MVPIEETEAYENALEGVTIHTISDRETNLRTLECEVIFKKFIPMDNTLKSFDALETAKKIIAMEMVRDILRSCGISDEDLYNLERISHDQYWKR